MSFIRKKYVHDCEDEEQRLACYQEEGASDLKIILDDDYPSSSYRTLSARVKFCPICGYKLACILELPNQSKKRKVE